jgi:hypothetical protein
MSKKSAILAVAAFMSAATMLSAASASAREHRTAHHYGNTYASARHSSGFAGYPTDYLIDRFGGRQAQGSL